MLSLNRTPSEIVERGCVKESGSHMWIYVFMGNMLCGIGETPIVPLGISYIDDFAKEGYSSLYLGIVNGIGMLGLVLGFILGSLFAKMYMDIGFVDLSTIRITPKDSRWVGAWWLGFVVSGLLSTISSIPFFFLPSNPNKPQKGRKVLKTNDKRNQTANLTHQGKNISKNVTGFFRSLKSILTNPPYVIFVLFTLLHMSSYICSLTHVIKNVEEQYGQSASQTNFFLGVISIPVIAIGMFLGGYIIKKFKLSLVGLAKLVFCSATMHLLAQFLHLILLCESKSVAGLTLTYDGNNSVASHVEVPLSYCNSECDCDESQWEPVCGNNGITYLSPCLAGCKSSSGNKKPIVFYNCSCVEVTGLQNKSYSAHLGECPRDDACARSYHIYVAVQVLNSFLCAIGLTSYSVLVIKIVQPELKALAIGFHSLIIRSLGGILAPIYFGALTDRTCMKWSTNSCGARGACRIHNSTFLARVYFGLTAALMFPTLVLLVVFIFVVKKKFHGKDTKASENERKVTDEANLEFLDNSEHFVSSAEEQ
ncbi:putative solute carrier organic anion transporter family member 1B7 isoform X2 [Aotus nancymaae]|nr:putative solute carrier organic anion transporter family member 1B7 isoform X2 [Aotus nancymaae]